ncbi:gypsy/ty3 retroelement polyprotein, partial [Tanacetum coccineum]
NAPSTFQALINEVFQPYLRKFTLFDDILVYSSTMDEHVQHLTTILDTMRQNKLFAKKSKCVFSTSHVEYLGHVISAEGVATDPSKINAMVEWPTPTNIKQLRGFLWLTGYYRRFIKSFAEISRPLTQLLKKGGYKWSNEAQLAFETLKEAMMKAPVLALPDFTQPFMVETDVSGVGLDTTLVQLSSKEVKDSWVEDGKLQAIIVQLRAGQGERNIILGLRKQVKQFVRECLVCQKYKPDLAAYPGLLQPLPIPQTIWSSISMDFIEGLPKSHNKNVIFVIVDRLSKYAHFITHPFTAAQVAQVFLDNVYKLHGMPESIVSDRDKIFLSTFWKELFKFVQVKLLMSTSYRPQTDGQTEVFRWSTPFEIMYGQTPPINVPYLAGLSKVEAVDRTLKAREDVIQTVKFHLARAQNRIKLGLREALK